VTLPAFVEISIFRLPFKILRLNEKKWKPAKSRELIATCSTLISLKIEMARYSETSVIFQQNTRCYVAEDRILHDHSSANLKSYKHEKSQTADTEMGSVNSETSKLSHHLTAVHLRGNNSTSSGIDSCVLKQVTFLLIPHG
jgi:hypothetical protein